ncbi:lantibiotic dehydratase [Crassaminicella indica]|uniref:Lantibiotic dehydratase n=1 Tax=Crassaminicella indica TaxID=2855394 RepID=A0ABX8RD82_9CLOT|nr:lantibiotic dehydratase [Crassaminicella indica]QXM06247.1 lantibiotic dehydratase [Crassaminicella indica]
MRYLCHDVFMVRVPSLSLKTFWDFNKTDVNISDYISKNEKIMNFMKESVLLSSKSLYASLNNPPTEKKKVKNYNLGLLKYFIRASTRPTPFGLFAGVGLGEFSDQTDISVNQKEYIKDISVDIGWMDCAIHKFESDINVVSQLKVKFNPICYLWGNRLKNPYFSNHGMLKDYKDCIEQNDIQYTNLIELIKKNTEKFTDFSKIQNIIRETYKDVPDELIDYTLFQLIENEYLITNLRIPAYCDNHLEHVIKVLGNNEYTNKLAEPFKEIKILLNKYNKYQNKLEIIETIYNKMKKIHKSKNYLKINKGLILNENCLSYEIKDKLEHFANCLNNISINATEYSKLDKFKEAFSQKFGLNSEVPLIDIIDKSEFNGLDLIGNIDKTISERERSIKKIIDDKIMLALMNSTEEVNLYNSDFSSIPKKEKKHKSSKSFDMSFYINKKDKDYNIIAGPAVSNKAGSIFQRFYNVFDPQLIAKYNRIYESEIKLTENEYLLVEVREKPVAGRVNNIINSNKNHEYYLAIACTDETVSGEIHINDLCIGLSQERELYIKSISKNKKCKIIMDNMLVSRLNSKIINLLRTISEEYEDDLIDRIFTLYKNEYIYTPRIKFEGIVIHPKSWNFSSENFDMKSLEKFKKSFDKVIHQYKIDDYVCLCEGDHRILVDLKHEEFLDIIYSSVKKNGELNLHETEMFSNPIVEDLDQNNYMAEFVFSFIQHEENKKILLSTIKEDFVENNRMIQNKSQRFSLGDHGWIYMKLYGLGDKENELLTKELPCLLDDLDLEKFFFLRYYENGKHLRLRFKFENENIALNKLHRIKSWIFELQKNRLINRTIFDVYEREVNRYGGLELIEYAEQFFYADSIFVINILNSFDLDNEKDKELLYMVGMISVLKELTHDEFELLEILDEENLRNKYRDEFKKERINYLRIAEYILKGEVEKIDKRLLKIIEVYKKRQLMLFEFKKQLEKQIEKKKTTNIKKEIIFSMNHMYCNRMIGDTAYEGKCLSIIRHSLHDLIEKWKYTKRK